MDDLMEKIFYTFFTASVHRYMCIEADVTDTVNYIGRNPFWMPPHAPYLIPPDR